MRTSILFMLFVVSSVAAANDIHRDIEKFAQENKFSLKTESPRRSRNRFDSIVPLQTSRHFLKSRVAEPSRGSEAKTFPRYFVDVTEFKDMNAAGRIAVCPAPDRSVDKEIFEKAPDGSCRGFRNGAVIVEVMTDAFKFRGERHEKLVTSLELFLKEASAKAK